MTYFVRFDDYMSHTPAADHPELYLGQRIGRIALRQVADWLRQCPREWTTKAEARDIVGMITHATSPGARSWCAMGRLELLADRGRFHAGLDEHKRWLIGRANDRAALPSEAAAAIEELI
jgi:hypothetical protein